MRARWTRDMWDMSRVTHVWDMSRVTHVWDMSRVLCTKRVMPDVLKETCVMYDIHDYVSLSMTYMTYVTYVT